MAPKTTGPRVQCSVLDTDITRNILDQSIIVLASYSERKYPNRLEESHVEIATIYSLDKNDAGGREYGRNGFQYAWVLTSVVCPVAPAD